MPRPKKSSAKAMGEPKRRGPRPGFRRIPGKRSTPKQPFSLILNPEELNLLKKMARQQGTSVAGIIRQALHSQIFSAHPEMAKTAIENEVETFLDRMGTKIALGGGVRAGREKLKRTLVKGLMTGVKRRG
jgi:hypothetical protein